MAAVAGMGFWPLVWDSGMFLLQREEWRSLLIAAAPLTAIGSGDLLLLRAA